jgi:DNA replication protein DnaC
MYTKETYQHLQTLALDIIGNHDECDRTGWKEDQPCECLQVFRYIKKLYLAGVPKQYWDLKLEDLQVKKERKEQVKRYLENGDNAIVKGLGFLFSGESGVGKTALVVEILKHFIVEGYEVLYTTAAKVLEQVMQDGMNFDASSFLKYSAVAIDELDKLYFKQSSEFAQRKVEHVFRSLLSGGKVLLICTNWTEKEIGETFGGAFVSLLKRSLLFLYFSGDDYSEKLQKNWQKELTKPFDFFSKNILHYALKMKGR